MHYVYVLGTFYFSINDDNLHHLAYYRENNNFSLYVQFQGNVDSGSQYSSGAPAHIPYGTQQNHVP